MMWQPDDEENVPEPTLDAVPELPVHRSWLRSRKLQLALVLLIATGFYFSTGEPVPEPQADGGPTHLIFPRGETTAIDLNAAQIEALVAAQAAQGDAFSVPGAAPVQVDEVMMVELKRDWTQLSRVLALLLVAGLVAAIAFYDLRFRPRSD